MQTPDSLTHLLLGSVIECRGCERFRLVSEQLEDAELSRFYKILWAVEAKHGNIYVEMALNYFDKDLVYGRLDELMQKEARNCGKSSIACRIALETRDYILDIRNKSVSASQGFRTLISSARSFQASSRCSYYWTSA